MQVGSRLAHRCGDVGDQARGRRVGIFVGIQPHRDVQLGSPVRRAPAEPLSQRQLSKRDPAPESVTLFPAARRVGVFQGPFTPIWLHIGSGGGGHRAGWKRAVIA